MTRDLCHVVSWPGGERGGLGEERVSDRDIGEKRGGSVVKCSVPQRPVALGDGVRDVQEGRAHQVEGFVREGCYIVCRHPLCLDLWEDLQSDGPCGGRREFHSQKFTETSSSLLQTEG